MSDPATSGTPRASEPFRRFEALTKKLLSVPKREVDEKESQRPKRERKPKKT